MLSLQCEGDGERREGVGGGAGSHSLVVLLTVVPAVLGTQCAAAGPAWLLAPRDSVGRAGVHQPRPVPRGQEEACQGKHIGMGRRDLR